MWTVEKTITFEASHVLPLHDGKCARLHGHSWKATIAIAGRRLQTTGPQTGMVVDFATIKAAVYVLHSERLDHHHLNDTTGLENPTSEALAQWLFEQMSAMMPATDTVWVSYVKVEETCTSACTYFPDLVVLPPVAEAERTIIDAGGQP